MRPLTAAVWFVMMRLVSWKGLIMFGWLQKIKLWWQRRGGKIPILPDGDRHDGNLAATTSPRRLERIVLTDGVARTLFDDYAEHRRSERGEEEIGWILLGLRRGDEAI